jgi:hypothetical protein
MSSPTNWAARSYLTLSRAAGTPSWPRAGSVGSGCTIAATAPPRPCWRVALRSTLWPPCSDAKASMTLDVYSHVTSRGGELAGEQLTQLLSKHAQG